MLVPPLPRRTIPEKITVGELTLDATRRRAWRGEEVLDLTPIELGILEDLIRHPGQVRSLDKIASALRKELHEPGRETPLRPDLLPPHVSRLRRKMDEKWPVKLIRTVRGSGYRLELAEVQGSLVLRSGKRS